MNKEKAIRFAGLMEEYLHIPAFVCETIEKQLEDNKYKEVVEYVIQRRNEIENKEDYISEQQAINMWINKLSEKDKEISRLNNIINELEKTFVNDDKRIKEYNIEHPERPLDNYSRYYLDKLKELKGEMNNGKDK